MGVRVDARNPFLDSSLALSIVEIDDIVRGSHSWSQALYCSSMLIVRYLWCSVHLRKLNLL